jgi:hypothetical protein
MYANVECTVVQVESSPRLAAAMHAGTLNENRSMEGTVVSKYAVLLTYPAIANL